MIELDRNFAIFDKLLIDDVQHFEKRHIFADSVGRVGLKMAGLIWAVLPPDLKRKVELFACLLYTSPSPRDS